MINARNIDAVDAMCTADYPEHDPSLSSYDLDLAQAKAENRQILEAFEPMATNESLVPEGGMVCARVSFKGRHVGTYQGVEATGREVSGTGHATFRCEDGKLAEIWWNFDDLGMLQLGVIDTRPRGKNPSWAVPQAEFPVGARARPRGRGSPEQSQRGSWRRERGRGVDGGELKAGIVLGRSAEERRSTFGVKWVK
ncbi:ester cyclase [Streptomyces exfoliatus]|uniref:ester cyclase n=1 Tax=Streptomyces exfoliatus TaxID=1905 RepID=UPI003C301AEF